MTCTHSTSSISFPVVRHMNAGSAFIDDYRTITSIPVPTHSLTYPGVCTRPVESLQIHPSPKHHLCPSHTNHAYLSLIDSQHTVGVVFPRTNELPFYTSYPVKTPNLTHPLSDTWSTAITEKGACQSQERGQAAHGVLCPSCISGGSKRVEIALAVGTPTFATQLTTTTECQTLEEEGDGAEVEEECSTGGEVAERDHRKEWGRSEERDGQG